MTKYQKMELIGKIVTVKKILYKTYEFDKLTQWKRWKEREIEPRAGWIVGFRTVYEGEYNEGFYDPLEGHRDPPYLDDLKPIKCVLVAYWPNLNPVKVPLDGFELGGTPKSSSNYKQGD